MIRVPRGLLARLAVIAAAGLTTLSRGPVAGEIAPFRTALAVHWGEGAGSDAFRDDLSRALAAALAGRCFESIVIVDPNAVPADADLVLTVVLSWVVEETRFDDSIATTLQPGEPTKELRRITYFEVTVDGTLSARATGTLVRKKHFVVHVSRRPIYVGEDPQATVRAEGMDEIIVNLTRAMGCGGAKLERRIREALTGAGEAVSGSR